MKVYTSKQINKILGELLFLEKEFQGEMFNSIGGEGLQKAIETIRTVILDGDNVLLELKK